MQGGQQEEEGGEKEERKTLPEPHGEAVLCTTDTIILSSMFYTKILGLGHITGLIELTIWAGY